MDSFAGQHLRHFHPCQIEKLLQPRTRLRNLITARLAFDQYLGGAERREFLQAFFHRQI